MHMNNTVMIIVVAVLAVLVFAAGLFAGEILDARDVPATANVSASTSNLAASGSFLSGSREIVPEQVRTAEVYSVDGSNGAAVLKVVYEYDTLLCLTALTVTQGNTLATLNTDGSDWVERNVQAGTLAYGNPLVSEEMRTIDVFPVSVTYFDSLTKQSLGTVNLTTSDLLSCESWHESNQRTHYDGADFVSNEA